MRSLKVALFAGAAFVAAASAASAADLPPIMHRAPQPVMVEEFTSGWYLRGDIGVSKQKYKDFEFTQTNSNFVWPASWRIDQKDIKDTTFFGVGIGYQWNSWIRVDVTGEYRNDVKFKALGSYLEFCPGGRCFDLYDGDHSAIVVLANAYFDLGTWFCLTPFVGVGVGSAYHRTKALTDIGLIADGTTGFGYANKDHANWDFAWAIHGGVAYTVNQNFKVELAYRYLNMGSADTAIINCAASGCATAGPRAYYTLRDMDSHDFKLGVRWTLQPEAPQQPMYMPPLMRKG